MKYARFEELPVWQAASHVLARVDAIRSHPGFRTRGDLQNQLYRATLSISNNIAEGFEAGTTEQLITFLYHARGSAGEVRSMLRQMASFDGFENLKSEISNLISQSEGVSRQLRGWLDSLQNSEIKGTRYLNDVARAHFDPKARAKGFVDIMDEARRSGDYSKLAAYRSPGLDDGNPA